jgi:hypothetical protein
MVVDDVPDLPRETDERQVGDHVVVMGEARELRGWSEEG